MVPTSCCWTPTPTPYLDGIEVLRRVIRHSWEVVCAAVEQGEGASASVAFDNEDVISSSWVNRELTVDANAPKVPAYPSLNDLAQSTPKDPLLMEGTR